MTGCRRAAPSLFAPHCCPSGPPRNCRIPTRPASQHIVINHPSIYTIYLLSLAPSTTQETSHEQRRICQPRRLIPRLVVQHRSSTPPEQLWIVRMEKVAEPKIPQEFILDAFADPTSVRDVVRGMSCPLVCCPSFPPLPLLQGSYAHAYTLLLEAQPSLAGCDAVCRGPELQQLAPCAPAPCPPTLLPSPPSASTNPFPIEHKADTN